MAREFRFGVSGAGTERSAVWRIWAQKSDVYIAARSTASDLKVSLHASGNWRIAFTSRHVSGPSPLISPDRDRAFEKWQRPPEMAPGITRAFAINVPASEVTPFPGHALLPQSVHWVPQPETGDCIEFGVFLEKAAVIDPDGWIGKNAMKSDLLWRHSLVNDETVTVISYVTPLADETRLALEQHKHVLRSSVDLDQHRSPDAALRALFIGVIDEDGTRFALDASLD